MNLVKFNQGEAFNQLPSIFDDLFGRDFFNRAGAKVSFPAVNVKESDEKFEVFLAAPGLKKEDFIISVNNNALTISSENKQEKEEVGEDGKFTRREYSYSRFSRSFGLPENVNIDEISAEYEDGELKLEIPKKTISKKTVRQIAVR